MASICPGDIKKFQSTNMHSWTEIISLLENSWPSLGMEVRNN
jgi:hypothetical protein